MLDQCYRSSGWVKKSTRFEVLHARFPALCQRGRSCFWCQRRIHWMIYELCFIKSSFSVAQLTASMWCFYSLHAHAVSLRCLRQCLIITSLLSAAARLIQALEVKLFISIKASQCDVEPEAGLQLIFWGGFFFFFTFRDYMRFRSGGLDPSVDVDVDLVLAPGLYIEV